MRHGRRTATAGTALLVVLAAGAAPALAGVVARATGGSTTTSSASWGAQAGPAHASAATGTYTLSFTRDAAVQYFAVYNTGSRPLTGQTYTAAHGVTNSALPDVVLEACVGATWDSARNSCAGTIVLLDSTATAASTTATAALPSPGALSVRATPSKNQSPQDFAVRITVAVSRSQAGAATTTSS